MILKILGYLILILLCLFLLFISIVLHKIGTIRKWQFESEHKNYQDQEVPGDD